MRPAPELPVRLVAVVALAVVAGVHLRLAEGCTLVGDLVTQGDLFPAQAAVAGVMALALLVRPTRVVWLLAAVVVLGSLLAVAVTVHVAVPAIGPLPRVFEPVWHGEKRIAAAAAAAAFVASLAGLLPNVRQRRRNSPSAAAAMRAGVTAGPGRG